MKNEVRKEMKMKERELSKEMLENVSGGIGVVAALGTTLKAASISAQVYRTLKCNKENSWGWKTDAKCSCGMHWY